MTSDYNFGIPSFPWVNGRDFAGIVVKTGKATSRIKDGDVVQRFTQRVPIDLLTWIKVFGPSTDYRDIRKAAYQEYVVTTDFNVARLPATLSANTGAALGVAFVSALLALGISLGFNFADAGGAPKGPDLLGILKDTDRIEVPEDIRDECFDGIRLEERPQVGDWFAIWGGKTSGTKPELPDADRVLASSATGLAALQLAKLIGLRVIVVADSVRHGARLIDLGADVLVDRNDSERAIEIIRNVTKGKLRFALDTVGKETATHLQQSLHRSDGGTQAHLVGLTGLPKSKLTGIKYHSVPIKVFHSVPAIGEQAMVWLEKLLVAQILEPPDVAIADGGLEGINEALDKLRSGTVSGKRIVVPIEIESSIGRDSHAVSTGANGVKAITDNIEYADKLNADPSRIKFA